MTEKKALVLAGGVPQIELIQKLKERGYTTILADYLEKPVAEPYADKFYRESTLDIDKIRQIAVHEQVDLIITCCTDQALATVSKVSEELGLPCYVSEQAGLEVTNKALMKERFRAAGVPTAPFVVLHGSELPSCLTYPLVVKPVDCNSSKGVVRVSDKHELVTAVANARSLSRTGGVIVEEYLEGIELSVDCFVVDGYAKVLCVSTSDKLKDGSGFVICRGQYVPEVHNLYTKEAQRIAQLIVEAFGLRNGPMLVQFLLSEGSLYCLEFSARTGGCVKYKMIELASGVDVIEATLDVTLRGCVDVMPKMSEEIVSDDFIYCRPGIFSAVVGFDEALAEGVIDSFSILKSSGAQMTGISNSGDRIVAVTIVARDLEDYESRVIRLAGMVDVLDNNGASIMRKDLLLGVVGSSV